MRRSGVIMMLSMLMITGIQSHAEGETTREYTPRDYSIVPPAPGVAQFLDFQNYSVDNFHGLPQISFPIYVIKSGAISVPITLSYHAGGIRTKQKCGNAGMGWTLSFGAEIGHTLNGAPDDAYHPTSSGEDKIHGLFHLNDAEKRFRSKLIAKKADYAPTNHHIYIDKNSWQATDGKRYYWGLTDVANDVYNLYGLGLSAVFAYDEGKNMVVSSDSPVKIEISDRNPVVTDGGCDCHGYKVQNQAGLTYYFTVQDRTRYDYAFGSPLVEQLRDSVYYASSWHLDEIEDLNGNKVRYKYHRSNNRCETNHGNNTYRHYSAKQMSMTNMNILPSVTSVIYYPQILDSIMTDGITVKFDYVHERSSDREVPLVKSISIMADNTVLRKIEFKYTLQTDYYLTSVEEQGDKILTFEYLDPEDNKYYFYTDSQDFGGYNNNIDNGAYLIPTVGGYGLGADRSVVPEYAVKGSLKKIGYPTGGYTEFVWESNDFNYIGTYENSFPALSDTPIARTVTDTIRMSMDDNYKKLKLTDWPVVERQVIAVDLTGYFCMNPANLFGTDYHHSHSAEYYPLNNPPLYPHLRFIRRDKTTGNTSVEKVIFLDKETIEDNGKNQPIVFSLVPGYYDVELVNPMAVQYAEDFLEANMLDKDSPAGRIFLSRQTYDVIGTQQRDYWCGLRIRRIISSTGDPQDTPLRKDFYYNSGLSPQSTSGTVNIPPRYRHMYSKMYSLSDAQVGYEDCQVTCIGETAFPGSAVGNISQIQYPEVTTNLTKEDRYEPDSYINNVVESFRYSSARTPGCNDFSETEFLSYQPMGARMYTSMDHHRGNLLCSSQTRASMSGGLTTRYGYNIHEATQIPTLTTDAFVLCDYSEAPAIQPYATPDYGIGRYRIIPYTKTISYEYSDDSEGYTASKEYEYFYKTYTDNLDYNLPKSITATTSEGDIIKTYFTYPKKNHFCLSQPETEVVTNGNTVVSAKRTEYDPNTLLPLRTFELAEAVSPTSIISLNQHSTNGQKSLINSPQYEYKYNSHGNLTEIRYKGIVLASYLWGYNGLYPIVEAKNTPYTTLYAAAKACGFTDAQLTGQKVTGQAQINTLASNLRVALPDSEISAICYHWIWGAVEMSDGRGVKSSFEYDTRGRLTGVRDFNDYLINRYQYHYQTDTDNL